jgi:hypothetical protein
MSPMYDMDVWILVRKDDKLEVLEARDYQKDSLNTYIDYCPYLEKYMYNKNNIKFTLVKPTEGDLYDYIPEDINKKTKISKNKDSLHSYMNYINRITDIPF